jgi:CheY-like chemotaxis protein
MTAATEISADEQPTILVVDDTPANLSVLLDALKNRGYRLLVARDGESALVRARYARPDLILLDIMMPGMDGIETCARLKADEQLRDIPVIFTTALTDSQSKVRGLQAGGVDYITKPFQAEEVLARVQIHLALRAANQRLMAQNALLEEARRRCSMALPMACCCWTATVWCWRTTLRSLPSLASLGCRSWGGCGQICDGTSLPSRRSPSSTRHARVPGLTTSESGWWHPGSRRACSTCTRSHCPTAATRAMA